MLLLSRDALDGSKVTVKTFNFKYFSEQIVAWASIMLIRLLENIYCNFMWCTGASSGTSPLNLNSFEYYLWLCISGWVQSCWGCCARCSASGIRCVSVTGCRCCSVSCTQSMWSCCGVWYGFSCSCVRIPTPALRSGHGAACNSCCASYTGECLSAVRSSFESFNCTLSHAKLLFSENECMCPIAPQ